MPAPESTDAVAPLAPRGWTEESRQGIGPFTTRIVYRLQDGSRRVWTSRHHRKHDPGEVGRVPRRTWWIASLFSIGSFCFALGSVPAYATAVGPRLDGITFFVGSIFFTSAAYLAFAEVCSTPDAVGPERRRHLRLVSWRPRSIDWWATWIQLVGTVAFNITTFAAMHDGWSLTQSNRLVWGPDVVGSIFFLVSSWLSWAEVCHGSWRWAPEDVSWRIVGLNLLGSIFFGLSAIGDKFLAPGVMRNVQLVNAGTFLGAVCFLVAAVLLVPEARQPAELAEIDLPDGAIEPAG